MEKTHRHQNEDQTVEDVDDGDVFHFLHHLVDGGEKRGHALVEDVERAIRKFKDYSEEDSLDIQKFVADNSLFFQDRPDEWIFVKDLLEQVPINFDYFERKVKQKNFFDKEQGGMRYLLYVTEYKVRDAESPFDLERERIKSIIINTRKRELLEDMRDRLFQDALDSNEIEIKS